jgi:hypothetical protein
VPRAGAVPELSIGSDQPVWYPVSAVLIGTGGMMSFTNHLDGEPQHYFRLRVLPP